MSRRGRVWIGITLVALVALNYAIIGIPLFKKAVSLETRYKTAVAQQLKGTRNFFTNTDDEYLIDIFRRERAVIARNTTLLNTISLSALIVVASWTAFGLVLRKGK